MKTIGFIGAGHIGSQVARLAVARLRRRDQQLARSGDAVGLGGRARPRARAATALEAARAGDIVVVTIPLKNYRDGAGRAAGGQDRDRHQQLLPAARRPHPRARQRVDHDRRAAAGAPADVEGGQGVQPHLRRRAHHDGQPAGTPNRRALVDRRRRRGRQGDGDRALDQFGFDTVDAGPLAEGWRIQRDTPGYGPRRTAEELRRDLAAAKRYAQM